MAFNHKLNNHGFSVIEILIVLIAVGLLVGIVAYTYAGIRARSRDNTRIADLTTELQTNIEAFYSQNMYYPSLKDMNSPSWRTTNLPKLKSNAIQDPSWTPSNKTCTLNNQPILLKKAQPGCYGYNPTNNGASCESNDTACNQYTLTANLEQGGLYIKTQLD